MIDAKPQPIASASDLLLQAYADGRSIIPFLGAGISVGSGFPSMTAITAYLAKVRFFIRDVKKSRRRSEAEYLQQHGWPDFAQLTADLWRHLVDEKAGGKSAVLQPFMAKLRMPDGSKHDDSKIVQEFDEITKWNTNRNGRLRLVVQSKYWDALSEIDTAAAQPLWPSILGETDLRGDWYDLMMSLTEGDFDLVDALFLALGHGRRPASDHVFLAQLADAFRVRLYLSLNFDPLLETALWDEGHATNVIEVAKDADLPSPEAVRHRLTVLKLHGGAYGLRIGERIQESADPNTRTRAKDLIPEDALILVLGFSGYERRMTQILVEHCRRRPNHTQLLWMNFGQRHDTPLHKLLAQFGSDPRNQPIAVHEYHGVSGLLQDVLIRARGAYPAGQQSYSALPTQPWAKPKAIKDEKPIIAFYRRADWDEPNTAGHSDASVAMAEFCQSKAKTHQIIWIDCEQHHTVDGVVAGILDTIHQYDPQFQPLLMHTGDQNVAIRAPIERIREALQRGNYVLAFDSPETIGRPQTVHHGTPSLLLPKEAAGLEAAADPVKRARMLDGMTAYKERVKRFNDRVDGFFHFLTTLLAPTRPDEPYLARDIGGSFIAVSLAPPSSRRPGTADTLTLQNVRMRVEELRRVVEANEDYICPIEITAGDRRRYEGDVNFDNLLRRLIDLPGAKKFKDDSYMILTVLRRPRSHLAYRALLSGPAIPPREVDEIECSTTLWNELLNHTSPDALTDGPYEYEPKGPRRVGGSLLWLPRLRHNAEYLRLTQTGHQLAINLAAGKIPDSEALSSGVLSLHATAILHRRAARYYFADVYETTGDMAAFREYIYHRVSYLRTLRRFLGVMAYGHHIGVEGEWKTRKLIAHAVGNYCFPKDNPWKNLPTDSDSWPSWNDIRVEVRRAWREELGAFRATLSREFDAVLRKLYAGTWISIIDRLTGIDVYEMFDEGVFRIGNESVNAPDISLCRAEKDALVADLRGQQALAWFEMADWGELLRAGGPQMDSGVNPHPLVADLLDGTTVRTGDRGKLSRAAVKNAISTATPDLLPSDFVRWFMRLLDYSHEHLRWAKIHHELTCPGSEGEDKAAKERDMAIECCVSLSHRLWEWLIAVELLDANKRNPAVRGTAMPPFSAEIKEVLRSRLAEHRLDILGAMARFGFRRHNAFHASTFTNAIDEARKTAITDAIDEARKTAIQLFEDTRRTVFHDGAKYNYYRAQSIRMVARCDYLQTTPEHPQRVARPIANLNHALRLLHRHGSPDALELLACYRNKAEAYILWAHNLSASQKYRAARNRLDAARSSINRAGKAFDRRRRNVSWWLRLCHLQAEWAVASCKLRVDTRQASPPQSDARDPSGPAFERDLRFGLDAVRAGLDGLIPSDVVDGLPQELHTTLIRQSNQWQWDRFVRLWLALSNHAKFWFSDDFDQQWDAANRAARLTFLLKSCASHDHAKVGAMYDMCKRSPLP